MDSFRDWNSIFISNAFIENISFDRNTTILNENGNVILPRELAVGMTINAMVSSAMTRSIPPQAQAFVIQLL